MIKLSGLSRALKTGCTLCFFVMFAVVPFSLAINSVPAWAVEDSEITESDRIIEVRYIGLGTLTPRDLELSLPFSPGDQWKSSFLQATKQAVENYYSKRGFYHAVVTTKVIRDADGNYIFVIQANEGVPCRISEIGISDPPGINGVANLRRFKAKLEKVLTLKSGDRYDEEQLEDRLRELREVLAREDFILANTDTVKLSYNDDRTNVKVDLSVKYGDRVTFGFSNNTVFTKGELNEVITQLKSTELGKDYMGVITRRFVENYKSLGYGNIKVETKVTENQRNKHITFIFKEGERIRIESLKIEGFSASNEQEMNGTFNKEVSRLVQRGYFVEKDIDKGVQIVLEALRAKGYLAAKLLSKTVLPVKNKNRVAILLQFYEGDQTFIEGIEIKGNQFLTRQTVLETLNIEDGRAFNPYKLEEGLQKLRSTYKEAGYLDSEIVTPNDKIVSYVDNSRKVSIYIEFREGRRIKIGNIRIQGLVQTREYIVRREVLVKTGDWWLANDIQILEDSLKRLGIFADVRIRPIGSDKGDEYRDMIIDLREGEPGVIEFGPGFRSDLGFRGFAQVGYSNLFGRNQTVTLAGSANRRLTLYRFPEYNLQTTFSDPRILSSRNGFLVGLSTSKRVYIDFNATQTQFFTSLDRRIFPKLIGKVTYRLERVRQFGALDAIDNQSLLIGSITPALVFDTRDNIFTTTKGQVTNISCEFAQPYFAGMNSNDTSGIGYYKWTGSTHFYLSLSKDIVWSNVIGGGYERNLQPRPNAQGIAGTPIPLIKTFRLGGYSSVRGFAEDSINRDRVSIGGTLSFINVRTQFDLPLVGELRISPFLDAGNLFVDDRFGGQPFFRAGTGIGLHYLTPIGPINFDYGFKLNRTAADSVGQFHFSVGLI